MRKFILSTIGALTASCLLYVLWVVLSHDPGDTYGRSKAINSADREKIESLEKNRRKIAEEGDSQYWMDRIMQGGQTEPPIKADEAIRDSKELFKSHCEKERLDFEEFKFNGIATSEDYFATDGYMWLVEFIHVENGDKYWVAFDRFSRTRILDFIDEETLRSTGLQ